MNSPNAALPVVCSETVIHAERIAKRRGVSPCLLWLGFLVIALVYLGTIGFLPLLGRDEPRYAQVAREMWQSGDWVTPRLGGYTWFEKPALLYWMLATSFSLFGVSEWSVRLAPALCGLATLVLLWHIVRQARNDWAMWTALTLATSGGLLFFAHGATFDIVLTCSMTLALFGFWMAQIESHPPLVRRYQAVFWVGIGFAFLAKGLVAFILCLGVAALYAMLRRERVRLGWTWGLPLALLVSATWYGPVILRNGWPFINEFFVQHHFQRFLSDKYKHHQPFWFYGPMLLILALPWTPALVAALAQLHPASLRKNTLESRLQALALAWLIVPVAFFSVSGSKLPGYILPALPGAFILIGLCLSRWTQAKAGRNVSLGLAALMLIGGSVITSSRWGDARAEQESVRSLFLAANAQGVKEMRVVQLHTMQRAAQWYAARELLYDQTGEPLRLQSPEKVAKMARHEPLLVLSESKSAAKLRTMAGLSVSQVGKSGDILLFVVRSLHTGR